MLQKTCHQTVSLHCNYSSGNSVHYLRISVSRVGRQEQKGPEPTTLNYLTVTHESAAEGCWADRVNLSKYMLFTDPVNPELRLYPEGSEGKGRSEVPPETFIIRCNDIIISYFFDILLFSFSS